ncbi:aspartate/glutamate racemase family protein [Anaerotignum faecicola]|nr:aspartate/glutamate racemase family protein [Anaerotignum faecicola]
MHKIGVINTSAVTLDTLTALFSEILPGVEIINIVDDSLLREVKAVGHITPDIIARMAGYALNLEKMGVEAILNQCSSVSEAVDVIEKMISVPYIKIDKPMAEKACKIGRNITVIATVNSTVKPSCELVENTAVEMGRDVTVKRRLVDGALDVLMSQGGKEKHDALVLKAIEEEADAADVIVLAQGSMYGMLPLVSHISVPVLASPRIAVEYLKDMLDI